MDIERFNEFVELAKRLSFTDAAKSLHISQPALSKHIMSLEKELDVDLFYRNGTSIALTEIGSMILTSVFSLLGARREIDSIIKAAKSSNHSRIVVGGLLEDPEIISLLSDVVTSLGSQYGYDFLEMRNTRYGNMTELMSEIEYDIILDYADIDDDIEEGFVVIPIWSVPFTVVLNENHRLASQESISIDQLEKEIFVKLEGNHISEAWRFVEKACQEYGFVPKTKQTYFMEIIDMLRLTSALNDEVLVLSSIASKRMRYCISPNCKILPLVDEKCKMPVAAVCRQNAQNAIMNDVIEYLRATALK